MDQDKLKQICDEVRDEEIRDEVRKKITFSGESLGVDNTTIYGDTPTFMQVPRADTPDDLKEANVVFMGFPLAGVAFKTATSLYPPDGPESGLDDLWRNASHEAPKSVREWSVYNSIHQLAGHAAYNVEYDLRLTDYLNIRDYGDSPYVKGDVVGGHAAGRQKVREIVEAGAIPLIQGGDHSVPIPGILGITDCIGSNERLGIIGFDSHFDLALWEEGCKDWEKLSGASQYKRALETPNVEPENIVLIGLRGIRNPQGWAHVAKRLGIRYFTINEIDDIGIEKVMEEALERVTKGTKHTYVTLDIDVIDSAICPGQEYPSTPGLTPREIIKALRIIGKERVISGFDISCLGPKYDVAGATSLLAGQCFVEVLSSLAAQFRDHNIRKWFKQKGS